MKNRNFIKQNYFLTIVLFIFLVSQTFGQNKFNLSLEREASILGIGSVLTISSLLINQNLTISQDEILSLDRNQINSFDRSAINYYSKNLSLVSDALLISSIISPISLILLDNFKNEYATIGLMYFETMMLNYAVTNLTKNISLRYRPFAYNPQVSMQEKLDLDTKKSFFSGHTSTAFASAFFLSTVYSEFSSDEKSKNYVWVGSISLATTVGLLRYFSGKHFPTDIIAGAVVGSLIGYSIPKIHSNNSNLSLSSSSSTLINVRYYFK
ncbi:MAG: phosphatase PAP2 family protein [Ignavibacteria bacterium]|nr:phosphatase PAP2 family protein [Ignavibacteria bacterium]